jgi:hypothetical protein
VYITGTTLSLTGISTPGSAQPAHAGGGGDDFVARFSPAGALIWATYCGSTGNEYNGLCTADATVIVTNASGCSDTSAAFTESSVTAIKDPTQLQNNIHIYPNPASTLLNIVTPVPLNITITGIDGRILMNKDNVKTMDVSNLANGMYMIRFNDKDGNFIKTDKFTKLSQ